MAGPDWSDDAPGDAPRFAVNVARALAEAAQQAAARAVLTEFDLKGWHSTLYEGCDVPSPAYIGRFRGEAHPDLVDYEVGVGPLMPDGLPDRLGVWASEVGLQAAEFLARLRLALGALDGAVAHGARPSTVDELREVVAVVAIAHGELLRIHPFVNGNGRTARLLAANVSLRYGLPAFVTLKPRPLAVAYARASRQSMGRPPAFIGDHTEATAVFTHLLALQLLGP